MATKPKFAFGKPVEKKPAKKVVGKKKPPMNKGC